MRRHFTSLALALTAVAVAAGLSVAAPVGAQGCAGDTVTASMSSATVSGPAWSVTGACTDARDYFTGEVQGHAFAIGISVVTYDDGHTGRLAFLSVRADAARTVTVIGMEDPGSGKLHFAGTVRQAAVGATGATVSGAGIGFPPLEAATVKLDFNDTAAPWPDWATGATTTTSSIPADTGSTVPSVPVDSGPAVAPVDTTTTMPSTTTTTTTAVATVTSSVPSVATIPSVPGMDLTTTTLSGRS